MVLIPKHGNGEERPVALARNPWIDQIRGVSILLVLFHHFNIAYRLNDSIVSRALGWDVVQAVARNGNYGVTIFFVVSGYLITSNVYQRWGALRAIDARAFYWLRAARILPCLLLLLLVVNGLALTGVKIFQNHATDGQHVSMAIVNLASLTFWMNVLIGIYGWVNYPLGVLWSLSVEEVFYLSLPFLCLTQLRELRLLAIWTGFILIGPAYRHYHRNDENEFLYAYLACFDAIAIGCCTAVLARRISPLGPGFANVRIATVLAMACLYLYWPISDSMVFGVTAMGIGAAILLIASHGRPATQLRSLHPIASRVEWFGKTSYELYLFHLIVLGGLRTIFPPHGVADAAKPLLLVAYFILSASLAGMIAKFYSEPLNRLIRRWTV